MDRVFLDANVLFSAAYREGSPLGKLWGLRHARLLTSELALEEARRNLPSAEARARLRRLAEGMEVVPTAPGSREWRREDLSLPANDRAILATAAAARATHFLTGDRRHFGPLYGQIVGGVQILKPSDYLSR